MKSNSFKEALNKNKTWIAFLATVMGFISDVLQPLSPFSEYLFYSSLLILIISLLSYLLISKFRNRVLPIILLSVASSFVSGTLLALQQTNDERESNGIIANTFPFFEKLQRSLGIVQHDIGEIKQTTKEIQYTVHKVDEKLDNLSESIGKQGGIIRNPQTGEEFYHNARIYELNGDYGNARKAYVKYFTFKENKLDPHLRFQSFLKIQEGLEGAKDIYQSMFSRSDELVDQYAIILLDNKDLRTERLNQFISQHEDFAPAYYELAKLYSEQYLGKQSMSDKRLEKEYVETFLNLNKQGKFARYFIDKDLLNEQVEYIQQRKNALDRIDTSAFDNPISVERMYSSSGFQLNLNILDDHLSEIFYRIDGKGEFKSTGYFDWSYIDTGKKMPKNFIEISHTATPVKEFLEFKYIDVNGKERGPFRYEWFTKLPSGKILDPKAESDIRLLKQFPQHWVAKSAPMSSDDVQLWYVHFSHIFGYADGVEKILYGIDTDKPNEQILPPYTFGGEDDKSSILMKSDFKKVVVQLYYTDGTKSNIETFNF